MQESLFQEIKPILTLLVVFGSIVGSILVFNNLYSLTPHYEERVKDFQDELDAMSCQELFKQIEDHIVIGVVVGGQGAAQRTYIDEFSERGCIKP